MGHVCGTNEQGTVVSERVLKGPGIQHRSVSSSGRLRNKGLAKVRRIICCESVFFMKNGTSEGTQKPPTAHRGLGIGENRSTRSPNLQCRPTKRNDISSISKDIEPPIPENTTKSP